MCGYVRAHGGGTNHDGRRSHVATVIPNGFRFADAGKVASSTEAAGVTRFDPTEIATPRSNHHVQSAVRRMSSGLRDQPAI